VLFVGKRRKFKKSKGRTQSRIGKIKGLGRKEVKFERVNIPGKKGKKKSKVRRKGNLAEKHRGVSQLAKGKKSPATQLKGLAFTRKGGRVSVQTLKIVRGYRQGQK